MNIKASKKVLSRDQIISNVQALMAGGDKPSWAVQTYFVGQKAVEDWRNFERRAMVKSTEKLGFQLVASTHSKSARSGAAPKTIEKSTKSAEAKIQKSSDDFGSFSSAERAFLDRMATHRDAFSATAVESRSKSHMKKS